MTLHWTRHQDRSIDILLVGVSTSLGCDVGRSDWSDPSNSKIAQYTLEPVPGSRYVSEEHDVVDSSLRWAVGYGR